MSQLYLSHSELVNALALRDLTQPNHGEHAMQLLLSDIRRDLTQLYPNLILQTQNTNPVVSVAQNYDELNYPADGASRDRRYSRYINDNLMLRTQTSSAIPSWLRSWCYSDAIHNHPICLLSHGLVYRRDSIDKWHTGEPHQADIWILMPKKSSEGKEINIENTLHKTIDLLLSSTLPTHQYRLSKSPHTYTENGVQIDILQQKNEDWVELGEGGVIHPNILEKNGWPSGEVTGIALGIGLDRLLMLRKGLPDIRLLRDPEPRVQTQMRDLSKWKPVSRQPKTERDLSLVVEQDVDVEVLGDQVRLILGDKAEWIEEIKVKSIATYESLPESAIERLGMQRDHVSLLLRIVLRHPSKSISTQLANNIRNQVYLALNKGHNYLAS